jgi:hypothetical protein
MGAVNLESSLMLLTCYTHAHTIMRTHKNPHAHKVTHTHTLFTQAKSTKGPDAEAYKAIAAHFELRSNMHSVSAGWPSVYFCLSVLSSCVQILEYKPD